MQRGVQQVWSPSQLHLLARAPSHVTARNRRPNQRTLGGLPWYLHPFKIWNLQDSEEDVSTPDSSHWSGGVSWEEEEEEEEEDHFSCFLLEDDGSSSVASTAAIETSLKGQFLE